MSYDYNDIKAIPFEQVNLKVRHAGTAIVTPQDAASILEVNNFSNRRLRIGTVTRYAVMMRNGQWDWCDGDDELKFGEDGSLLNGQHRLTAQVMAGVTGAYDYRTQVPTHSFKNMDRQLARVNADYFKGNAYNTKTSALSRAVLWAGCGQMSPSSKHDSEKSTLPTTIDEIDFCEAHYDEMVYYVKLGGRIRDQHKVGRQTEYSKALYIIDKTGGEAEAFVDDYVSGENGTSITKETVLKKILSDKKKLRGWYEGVVYIAYDAWLGGRGVKVIRDTYVKRIARQYNDVFASEWNENPIKNRLVESEPVV